DGSMPPGGRPRPTPQEVDTLRAWIAASAPRYPRAFDDRFVLDTVLDDLDRQPPAAAPSLRYLSLAHLIRAGARPPPLADAAPPPGRSGRSRSAAPTGSPTPSAPAARSPTTCRVSPNSPRRGTSPTRRAARSPGRSRGPSR